MAASWLIGSNPNVGAVTVTVTANAVQEVLTVTSEAQAFYLYNGGGSFDALAAMVTALQTHTQISTATAVLRRDRTTAITADVAWEVDSWSGAGGSAFQTLLGFSGEELVSSQLTQVSDVQSAYLWTPGFCETPIEGRLGEIGVPYHDTAVGQSGNRVIVATTNNSGKLNTFVWENVLNDRVWTEDEDSEEYFTFWDVVIRRFRQFQLWREVDEDTSSTDDADFSAGSIGPYKFLWDGQGPLTFPYERNIQHLEYLHPVRLPVVQVDEYS